VARRKYKRRRKTSITLNKYKIGLILIGLGGIYFFSLYLAKWSPIFEFLTQYASIAFWEIWLNVFFMLCILTGIFIIAKWYLMSILIKQAILVMIAVSAIINFPFIENNAIALESKGWFISRPIIFILDKLFGGQTMAIEVLIIILFIVLVGWILYTFNFSFPKINIKVQQEKLNKRSNKKQRNKNNTDAEMRKKISEAKNSHKLITEKHLKTPHHINEQPQDKDTSILKSIIKQKVQAKITEKTIATKPRTKIRFSAEKPTFGMSLLVSEQGKTTTIDENFLMEKAKALQSKLLEFNVPISIEWFDIWPSIVQIKIKPEAGIRVSTIEKLANDISLSLRTKSLSVLAPIPWTSSVGIQLPNPKPSMVRLGDVLNSPEFVEEMKKSETNLALGKKIDWSIAIKTLEKMPHLLVAWATWSGKSVWVNDFILSLMYQNTPSELKFLMVDPKQVELEMYSWLPYMLWPIVTDADKALKLLKWAVDEMETRYKMLKDKRVKKIDEYNAKIIGEKMYRIVFVIDELADLMMSGNKKEVESCITRIAQKARAVGIHLIVATQRPSVNVITWLIKANMPTRIAFGVVSEIDSRTILGRKWAEELLGKWDMLYMDPTTKRPIRIQAPFVDTPEIERVVQRLKHKYMWWLSEDDIYHPEVIKALEDKLETIWNGNGYGWVGWHWNDAELIEQAIQVISQTRKASATLLQRRLNVGFARAARIMDALEERWIVGPQDGAKAREIFL